MIESLEKVSPDSVVYVLAFDDKCYEVLSNISYKNVKLISMKDFESNRMLAIKRSRSHKSYCWSCTPFLIKYVLEDRGENICTYIDADMLFYSNPDILIEDIDKAGADVGIVEHRFGEGTIQEEQIRIAGRYCVEFNTFKNNENALKILNWWADKCEECCTDDTSKSSDGLFGDQMYLTDWLERFDNIYVMQNHGGGMAPWNVYRYRLIDNRNELTFEDTQEDKGTYMLVFYHFHDVTLYADDKANINVYGRYGKSENPDSNLINTVYVDYLKRLSQKRTILADKYNINWPELIASAEDIKNHYGSLYNKLRHINSYKNFKKNIIDYGK